MTASATRNHAFIVAGIITLLLVSSLVNLSETAPPRSSLGNDGLGNRTGSTCFLSECSLV